MDNMVHYGVSYIRSIFSQLRMHDFEKLQTCVIYPGAD
ncbi:unnamed protein product [Staurois parvus]|uniref:Uncharacterized protein n=1 Tax=Staurois parvus TaxID=386267 RepID=A0ABN9F9Q2_9NEOB|nr:unnamed protein product [Staurois parvus]